MKKDQRIGIRVTRAELRKRKIILVLEPDLLSNESFAAFNTWADKPMRDSLQEVNITVQVKEKDGILSVTGAFYAGSHYTNTHTQISSLDSLFLEDKEAALHWMKETKFETVESRSDKILAQWKDDPEFAAKLAGIYNGRREEEFGKQIQQARDTAFDAFKKLQQLIESKYPSPIPF